MCERCLYDVAVVNHRVIGWLGFHENHRKCSFRCDGFAHAQASGRLTGGCLFLSGFHYFTLCRDTGDTEAVSVIIHE